MNRPRPLAPRLCWTQFHLPFTPRTMNFDATTDRRAFMAYFTSIGLGATLLPGVLWAQANQQPGTPITKEMLAAAEQLSGLELTDDERAAIVQGVTGNRRTIQQLHAS